MFITSKGVILTGWDLLRHRPSGFAVLTFFSLAALLISISGNIAVNGITGLLQNSSLDLKALLTSAVIFFVGLLSATCAWILRETFSTFQEQTFAACAEPREVLIFFVSHQTRLTTPPPEQGALVIDGVELPRTNLLEDARRLSEGLQRPFFNWEMILRGIAPHHQTGMLERVYLIGSAPGTRDDDKGTERMLPVCKAFLQAYIPGITIIPWGKSCDFEMMADVQSLLNTLIDEDQSTYRSHENQICIDITGGQKPSSAAASLASVNRHVAVQYVQTLQPKEAHRYNLSYRTAPENPGSKF